MYISYVEFVLFVLPVTLQAAIPSVGPSTRLTSSCSSGYYGYGCRHHCHCADSSRCDVTAQCEGLCADGWSGPTCQSQNRAFRMPSRIRARDPDLNSRFVVDGNSSTCITSEPDSPGWLRINLQSSVTVYHLTIVTEGQSARGWLVYITPYSDFYWDAPCATVRSNARFMHMSCDSPIAGQYITVLNTQGPITICEIQVHVCADFTFGAQCEKSCQCADDSEVCHPLTGYCRTGCRPGFSGRHCQQKCQMMYGSNCALPCGHCNKGVACDPVSGACPGLCQPGWSGTHCNATCRKGRYGQNCEHRCGGCQDSDTCSADMGLCPGLCQTGLQGPRCDQECQAGRHGPSCQFQCGRCLNGTKCNPTTGICPEGCSSGWEGLFCTQECLPYSYGLNCQQKCLYCLMSCDSHTGLCDLNGCRAGRTGQFCSQDCEKGYYGIDCVSECGHCQNEEMQCDIITGDCPDLLCKAGWIGSACDIPCPARRYGINCSLECGRCEGSDICDPVTGLCPGDCASGFHGKMCQTLSIFISTTNETSIALVATILTITFLVVAVVCICLVFKWRRDKDIVTDL